MGKSSINGPFSMAMLNNQRVIFVGYYLTSFVPSRGHRSRGHPNEHREAPRAALRGQRPAATALRRLGDLRHGEGMGMGFCLGKPRNIWGKSGF